MKGYKPSDQLMRIPNNYDSLKEYIKKDVDLTTVLLRFQEEELARCCKLTDSLPKLFESWRNLVKRGRSSIYDCKVTSVPDAKHIISIPGPQTCACGHSDTRHTYLLNSEGEVIMEISKDVKVDIIKVTDLGSK